MTFIDLFRLSFANLFGNKLRTLLTILGVSIGIGAIVFLYGLGSGLQVLTIDRIAQSQTLSTLDVTAGTSSLLTLDKNSLDTIKAIPGVDRVSPSISLSGQASAKDVSTDIVINGVESTYHELQGLKISAGSFLPAVATSKPSVVISTSLMSLLGFGDSSQSAQVVNQPLSLTLYIPEKNGDTEVVKKKQGEYQIAGIIDDEAQAIAYIPLEVVTSAATVPYSLVKVKVSNIEQVESIKETLTTKGYSVASISDLIDQISQVFRIAQWVLGGFGVIALSVAAIGMFNTMTIALLERTRDIGIMRALGAQARDMRRVFITEATIIGLAGGILGIALAHVLSWGIGLIVDILANRAGSGSLDLFNFPPLFLLFVVAFSVVVGFLTGIYPALRAARLNPLRALRYE